MMAGRVASAALLLVALLAATVAAKRPYAPADAQLLSDLPAGTGLKLRLNDKLLVAREWSGQLYSTIASLGRPKVVADAEKMVWVTAGRDDARKVDAVLYWSARLARWTVIEANVTIPSGPVTTPPKSAAAVTANIMSYNIRYGTANDGDDSWPYRSHLVMDLISRYDPDLLGTQESLEFQIEEILAAHPHYWYVGIGRDDGMTAGEYSPIFYRTSRFFPAETGTFWFCDEPYVPGCTSYGNTLPRISTWARFVDLQYNFSFYHYNLHVDHLSQQSREMSIQQLLRHINARHHTDLPVIITGDFNCLSENSTEIQQLRDSGYVDTFRVLHPDATDVGTHNGFKGDRTGPKIDYVWTSTEHPYEVTEADIIHDNDDGQYPSDHFPVYAILKYVEQ